MYWDWGIIGFFMAFLTGCGAQHHALACWYMYLHLAILHQPSLKCQQISLILQKIPGWRLAKIVGEAKQWVLVT